MSARVCKVITILIAASLLLTSCSLVKQQRRSAARREAPSSTAQNENQELRRENTALRENNKLALERMEALAKQMEAERAEQRRFRDMMATNFDLLEQSVAVSLAKSSGSKPVMQPDKLELPPPPPDTRKVYTTEASRPAKSPRGTPPEASPARNARPSTGGQSTGAAAPAANTAPAAYSAPGANGQPMAKTVAQTVAVVSGGGALASGGGAPASTGPARILDDPDLLPPASPRSLKSHGAAKPLYEKGFRHFARKDFGQTILIYQDFLERFPEDNYSDNAQFWIGESYFRQNRLEEAEMAYRQVLRNYEHRSTLEGYKTPDAIFRIAQTYLKRNDTQTAKYYFAAAAERFPATSAGRKAQRELATLVLKTASR